MKKQIKFALLNLVISLFGLATPELARGQYVGTVSLQGVQQTLGNTVSCTGSAQVFVTVNLGQTQHLLTAASTAASFAMEIDGIDKLGNVFKISNPMITVTASTYLIQGSGYMPIIEASVTCTSGSTFSLSYSGSFTATPIANVGAPGSSSVQTTGNVQGVIAQGNNGAPIFPLADGAVLPAINAQFVTQGVDNFSTSTTFFPTSTTGTLSLPPAITPAAGEWGLAFSASAAPGTVNTLNGPWACIEANCTNNTAPNPLQLVLNPNASNTLSYSVTNSTANANAMAIFTYFKQQPAIRQHQTGNQTVTQSTPGNTLAGSTIVVAVSCTTFPCQVNAITDTQAMTWRQIASLQQQANGGTLLGGGVSVWIAGPSSGAAETVTFTPAPSTTISGSSILELTGLVPGSLTTPLRPIVASNPVFAANENDNGGLFTEAGGFSVQNTVTLSSTGTFTFALWDQTQHGAFFSCVLAQRVTNIAGAATTLNTYLQDSADKVGFNDRLSMVQSTTAGGANNQLGAVSGGSGGITPAATTDGSLAAGSKLDGPLAPFGRLKFVTTGAAVAVTVTYAVVCR